MLEPDWVFETRPAKLSQLLTAKRADTEPTTEQASLSAVLQRVATPCTADPHPTLGPTNWLGAPLCLEQVVIDVRRALPCEWKHFREHHYKDHRLVANAWGWVCVLAGRPVGCVFATTLVPNIVALGRMGLWCGSRDAQATKVLEENKAWLALPESRVRWPAAREHRTVVHPDFQGCSIGSALSDAVAREHELQGWVFQSKTAHPHFGSYRDRSSFWAPCPSNGRSDKDGTKSYSHFWIGAVNPDGSMDAERQEQLAARVLDRRAPVAGFEKGS